MITDQTSVRLDKYLWSIRLYKTRSQAAAACRSGKISLNNRVAKASATVSCGDQLIVRKMPVIYTYRIEAIPPSRVNAKLVPKYATNLTPEEEMVKLEIKSGSNTGYRKRGEGRPTKKERRSIDRLREMDT